MGQPAAKRGDQITATDMHIEMDPAKGPTPLLHPFAGSLSEALSEDVRIMGQLAAVVGSTAKNKTPHVEKTPGATFQKPPPSNKGTIQAGSTTVKINGKPAARHGDPAATCNDAPGGVPGKVEVEAGSTVSIG